MRPHAAGPRAACRATSCTLEAELVRDREQPTDVGGARGVGETSRWRPSPPTPARDGVDGSVDAARQQRRPWPARAAGSVSETLHGLCQRETAKQAVRRQGVEEDLPRLDGVEAVLGQREGARAGRGPGVDQRHLRSRRSAASAARQEGARLVVHEAQLGAPGEAGVGAEAPCQQIEERAIHLDPGDVAAAAPRSRSAGRARRRRRSPRRRRPGAGGRPSEVTSCATHVELAARDRRSSASSRWRRAPSIRSGMRFDAVAVGAGAGAPVRRPADRRAGAR